MQISRPKPFQFGVLLRVSARRCPCPNRSTISTRQRFLSSTPLLLREQQPRAGLTTPVPDNAPRVNTDSPFYFEAGYALFAKRPSRPFPPPFLSYPSGSFSDPLTTHHGSRDRRPTVNGEMIRGVTNGDDAVLVSDYFIGANDGVGAWATREKGHAA